MNENRNANALPGRTGSKADYFTQQEIMRRTADVGPGGSIIHHHTGSFIEQKRSRSGYVHPWKVSATAGSKVRIAPGQAFHWSIEGISSGAAMVNVVDYEGSEGEDITESGTSYVYAKITLGSAQVEGQTTNRQLSSTVSIVNDSDGPGAIVPGAFVYLLLATVEKSGSDVTVTQQHLTHNPIISIQDPTNRPQWHVTANGDNTVTVNEGTVHFPAGAEEVVYNVLYNAEAQFTVTASGILYFRVALSTPIGLDELILTDEDLDFFTLNPTSGELILNAGGVITPGGYSLAGSSYAYLPIANIALVAGVASVVQQYAEGAIYLSMQSASSI